MAVASEIRRFCCSGIRRFATVLAENTISSQEQPLKPFISPVSDPNLFSLRNQGQWYEVASNHFNLLKQWHAVPGLFVRQTETFRERRFMIRQPLLNVLNCWKAISADLPVTRFVLYGRHGCGKTITLAQLIHAALLQNYLICYVPFARNYNRHFFTGIAPSTWKADRVDFPMLAAEWLKSFKIFNESLVTQAELVCSKNYVWSTRETTESGQPLMAVVEMGISRPRFACDCVGVLLKELKAYASQKKIKMFVGIDSANSLFAPLPREISKEPGEFSEISLRHAFKKLMKNDWNNGIVICTVDPRQFLWYLRTPHLPYYLLSKEGFEWLDPFIPVEIDKYSDTEAFSCVDYYIERRWIQNERAKTDEGRKELVHLSGHNPLQLERLCASI